MFTWAGKGEAMNNAHWLDDLNGLMARFSRMGMGADMGALSLCELWLVYCLLRRWAESQSA